MSGSSRRFSHEDANRPHDASCVPLSTQRHPRRRRRGARGMGCLELGRACLDGGATLLQLRAKQRRAPGCSTQPRSSCAARRRGRPGRSSTIAPTSPGSPAPTACTSGQDDLSPAAVRRIIGPERLVGLSTHTIAQLDARRRVSRSTYVAIGPVFGTATKRHGYDAVGLTLVREAAGAQARRPAAIPGAWRSAASPRARGRCHSGRARLR